MTKAELVARIAEEAEITKKSAETVLNSLVSTIRETLAKDGEIRINDLGSFKVTERKARQGVNPRTGEKIKIPAMKVPSFRAAKSLKEAVVATG